MLILGPHFSQSSLNKNVILPYFHGGSFRACSDPETGYDQFLFFHCRGFWPKNWLWSCLILTLLLLWWLPLDCWHPLGFILLLFIDTCIFQHLAYLCCKCIIFLIYTRFIARLSVLGEGSSSPWGFFHSLEVFPRYEGPSSEGVVFIFSKNCKAPWDKCKMCDIGLYK